MVIVNIDARCSSALSKVLVVGDTQELGEWDPSRGVALTPSIKAIAAWRGSFAVPEGALQRSSRLARPHTHTLTLQTLVKCN